MFNGKNYFMMKHLANTLNSRPVCKHGLATPSEMFFDKSGLVVKRLPAQTRNFGRKLNAQPFTIRDPPQELFQGGKKFPQCRLFIRLAALWDITGGRRRIFSRTKTVLSFCTVFVFLRF